MLHIFAMGRPTGRKYSANTGLRLDPGLKDALEQIAAIEDRSVAQVIRVLLREAIREREKKNRKKKPA